MSDDEADPELLELLRQSLGIGKRNPNEISSDTNVLKDAEHVYHNAIDVSIDMIGTQSAAMTIYQAMQERSYSFDAWEQHELHPKQSEGFSEVDIVNFVFTMDLLNFSFWSALPEDERFQVEYRGKRWTGYNSLVACLRRALDNGIPITTPRFWTNPQATDENLKLVFFSATTEGIPLLDERLNVLREASTVLQQDFSDPAEAGDNDPGTEDSDEANKDDIADANGSTAAGDDTALRLGTISDHSAAADESTINGNESAIPSAANANGETHNVSTSQTSRPDLSVVRLVEKADGSAGKLVNLLAKHFPCFRDETRFDGRKVRILKRAQIFVADLWAALKGTGLGEFRGIDHLTMFADYRVPQMLHSLGVLSFSPPLNYRIIDRGMIESGHSWEVQLRACSIWAVELIRRQIVKDHPGAHVNAVLIDFFLYDLAKEREFQSDGDGLRMPHHRTRSIWY